MHLSVIVPALNEEKILAGNIKKFYDYLIKQNYDFEIIIVNDGSTDGTKNIAQGLARKYDAISLINFEKNRGKGVAVCAGLLAGKGNYRLFLDADNATNINHLEKVWPQFNAGADIVIGSRNPRDAKGAELEKPQIFWKRFLGRLGNRLIRLARVKGIWDTQCGFKIFTKKTVETIIPKIKTARWAFDVEILARAQRQGKKIAIIPVTWICGPKSQVGLRGYFIALWELVKIKISLNKK